MKKLLIISFLIISISSFGITTDSLSNLHNSELYYEIENLQTIEKITYISQDDYSKILDSLNLYFNQINNPLNDKSITSPWNLPSFWFSFVLSAVGAYTIYGIGLSPAAFGIVYFSSKGDKTEVRKAIFGCLAGIAFGGGLKLLVMNMRS